MICHRLGSADWETRINHITTSRKMSRAKDVSSTFRVPVRGLTTGVREIGGGGGGEGGGGVEMQLRNRALVGCCGT